MIDRDFLRRLGVSPVWHEGREWWWLDGERAYGIYYGPAPMYPDSYLCGHTATVADILPYLARRFDEAMATTLGEQDPSW
jgi:hypothetical protein